MQENTKESHRLIDNINLGKIKKNSLDIFCALFGRGEFNKEGNWQATQPARLTQALEILVGIAGLTVAGGLELFKLSTGHQLVPGVTPRKVLCGTLGAMSADSFVDALWLYRDKRKQGNSRALAGGIAGMRLVGSVFEGALCAGFAIDPEL